MNTRRPARAASCRVEHDLARREVHWIRRRSKASSPASSPLYFQWLSWGNWLPFISRYRTMCLPPSADFRRVLDEFASFVSPPESPFTESVYTDGLPF